MMLFFDILDVIAKIGLFSALGVSYFFFIKHIILLKKRKFFKMEIIRDKNNITSIKEVNYVLEDIKNKIKRLQK